MTVFVETERLLLRQFTVDDVDHLFELDSDPDVIRFTPNAGQLPDRVAIQTQVLPKFLAYYKKYEGYGVWAAVEKSSQQFIGWFFLRPAIDAPYFDPTLANPSDTELGYRLRKTAWGKGYATEGVQSLLLKGFSEFEMQRVAAVALSANLASLRVLEKVGLKLQARLFYEALGQEVMVYALAKDEFSLGSGSTAVKPL
ncbi:GNAT family N-acetyltransferase [Leptolyngbya sp. FACHB-261]|uniref:GNAT family N-acetyltransferase n=1 Tax=Leptolyngbya sp. FACHB-261 TaxID=2692806 RepID=UPI00168707DA|nr:GNAT family N-acetyltransferase [Leptolyngbya sp. FACHB-261]MBD2101763.1 GNAT family N-acetyltransferase [Leptolyngbya sp. FACHB-261]